MQEEKKLLNIPHNLILEDRKSLSISGVEEIESFDENIVVLSTNLGELTIRGSNLHINKLNVETGELSMDGTIIAIVYSEQHPKKQNSLISKMFR